MSRILAASLVAVVFSSALFIYSVLDPGPYGATHSVALDAGSQRPIAVPALAGSGLRGGGRPLPQMASLDLGPGVPAIGATRAIGLRVATMQELLDFYEAVDFGNDHWREAVTSVPPVFLTGIPEGWVAELGAEARKNLFFRAILPLVLAVNDQIMADRQFVLAHFEARTTEALPSDEALIRLGAIAAAYGVLSPPDKGKEFIAQLSANQLKELALRVDVIPVSLALGQAAYESGYATSRLATGDNGLFGLWRDGDGMRPRGRRSGNRGEYRTPLDSTRAYTHNLNTHPTYAEFREERATMRAEAEILDGHALAAALVMYSPSGVTYTNTLRAIIAENRLSALDAAALRDDDPVEVVAAAN